MNFIFGMPARRSYCRFLLGLSALICATASGPAGAQQKTGPGITGEDSLTWRGITLYGVIDIGLQYDTHSAPFTPYRPAASGNIIRSNGRGSVIGLTPSNMGQSRVGLQGVEPLSDDWSAVFQIETFFNPQSGQIADSLRSLTSNNAKPVSTQNVGVDGSSAGQAFQTAYVGLNRRASAPSPLGVSSPCCRKAPSNMIPITTPLHLACWVRPIPTPAAAAAKIIALIRRRNTR